MKVKTRKLIAAITATALLGTAVGVSAYALSNSNNNDFGFKGTYSLNAFAAAKESTITVGTNTVDVTDILTIKSADEAYTLFLTVVDTADMSGLTNIKVGYKIGENYYNGISTGTSKILYSSLTIHTNETETETIQASSYVMTNATNPETTAVPMFVIAEVTTETVGSNTAELTITGQKIKTETFECGTLIPSSYTLKTDIVAKNATKKLNDFFTIKPLSSLYGAPYENMQTADKSKTFTGAVYANGSLSNGTIELTVSKTGTLTVYYGGSNSGATSKKAESVDQTKLTVIKNVDPTATTVGYFTVAVTANDTLSIYGTTSNRLCIYALELEYTE
ncbi:MAG: hypothetical protein ACI4MQ_04140 [Candidatus Coproplasma sp.]